MTSMLPLPPGRPADPPTFRDRLRHGGLLGGVARTHDQVALAVRAGLDFVAIPSDVVPPPGATSLVTVTGAADVAAVTPGVAGLLAEVTTAQQAAAVVAASREDWAVVVLGPAELADVAGVDAVLRVVPGPDAVSTALAPGPAVVAYDLATVLDTLAADLARGRPEAVAVPEREPLVLLSGMLGDASLWDGLAARLADVVLPWPARIDLDDSVPAMAETVLAAAPSRFVLAGHSLGAIVALEIVRQAPERVTRLVLVNASARGPVDAQQQAWSAWRDRTHAGGFADVAAELARATLAPDRRDDAEVVALNERMAHAVGPAGFLRQLLAQSTRPDSLESLAAIAVPTTVFSGEDDGICPPALQRELVARCPAAELVSLPGGHMLPLENPAGLAAELRARLVEPQGQ